MENNTNRIDFVKKNYQDEKTPYDLATSLLADLFTDDLDDLIDICENLFGKDYYNSKTREVVEEAYYDYLN